MRSYLADRLSGLGRPGIAAEFATTRTVVLHALKRAGERIASEPDFARDVAALMQQASGPPAK